jgi:hypothetical protein
MSSTVDKIKPWQDDLLYLELNLLFAAGDNETPHSNRFFQVSKILSAGLLYDLVELTK